MKELRLSASTARHRSGVGTDRDRRRRDRDGRAQRHPREPHQRHHRRPARARRLATAVRAAFDAATQGAKPARRRGDRRARGAEELVAADAPARRTRRRSSRRPCRDRLLWRGTGRRRRPRWPQPGPRPRADATPIDTVTGAAHPVSQAPGSGHLRRARSKIGSACSAGSSTRIMNSSPPHRATRSSGRTTSVSTLAT